MNLVVETRELTKCYGSRRAVDRLDLAVPLGAVYALLGPNGAGKSTTLRLLLGLSRPTSGDLRLFGAPWSRTALWRVGSLVETPALYGHLTGAENLEVHTRLLGLSRSRIADSLASVDLASAAHQRVDTYSLGMKQRLGLALALLTDPELLVLDEPTNGLDPIGIRQMRDLLRHLAGRGITVLVSSHLLGEVAQVATHVGVLAAGQLRFQGPLSDLLAQGRTGLSLTSPRLAEAYSLLQSSFPGTVLDGTELFVPVAPADTGAVVGALGAAGIEVSHVNYRQEDLEAVFLRLVGQSGGSAQTIEGRLA